VQRQLVSSEGEQLECFAVSPEAEMPAACHCFRKRELVPLVFKHTQAVAHTDACTLWPQALCRLNSLLTQGLMVARQTLL